jgi:hypothetical protein
LFNYKNHMTLLLQPKAARQCGQHCVAMVAGITLAESIVAFDGKKAGTTTKQVVAALKKLGYAAGPRLQLIKGKMELPPRCILKQQWPKQKGWHWVVYDKGKVYCPDSGIFDYGDELPMCGSRFTSFLLLSKMEG